MNAARGPLVGVLGLALFAASLAGGPPGAQVREPERASIKPAAAAAGIENPAVARPLRERLAVYVILGWVWFAIAVLLYLLRLRVREADRVHGMDLVRAGESPPERPGH